MHAHTHIYRKKTERDGKKITRKNVKNVWIKAKATKREREQEETKWWQKWKKRCHKIRSHPRIRSHVWLFCLFTNSYTRYTTDPFQNQLLLLLLLLLLLPMLPQQCEFARIYDCWLSRCSLFSTPVATLFMQIFIITIVFSSSGELKSCILNSWTCNILGSHPLLHAFTSFLSFSLTHTLMISIPLRPRINVIVNDWDNVKMAWA